jgi:ATP-dependent DNA helicase RecQ
VDITSIENKSILMFDEFQDINQEEWELIELIIEKSEKPRVIAVGDDDQNIYSFRGSSNAFMSKFRSEYSATLYTLPKNYRSYPEIVEFNNHVLDYLKNRLKSQRLIANRKRGEGTVNIIKYNGKYLEQPLVEYVNSSKLLGSKAVLTRTNIQALQVSSMLKDLGYKVKLMAGFDGFRISDLFEIRSFDRKLSEEVGESGIILETSWELAIDWFRNTFKESLHFETCIQLIKKFDFSNPDKKLLIDWREYCREINMEDVIKPDSEIIVVSTMHKAKGKEYDHVFMLVEDYDYTSNESRRLLYVASSRAKKTLHIHTNIGFYDNIESKCITRSMFEGELREPLEYEMILSHKDVGLNSFNYPSPLSILRTIKTGDKLEKNIKVFGDNEAPGLGVNSQGNLLLFSKNFVTEQYNPMLKKGYDIKDATAEYIVYWYNKNDDKEYKIVLPRLRFEKGI